MSFTEHSKKRVSYFYDGNVGNRNYGRDHAMKPHRITMANNLIVNYGLYQKMMVYCPYLATADDMKRFHDDDYIQALRKIQTEEHTREMKEALLQYCIGTKDCPIFEGMYEFCQISAGGSIAAAINLNKGDSEICINWSGGLHHAKRAEASGFCYVNDIVLAILELLKYHQRVLYIDIDIHHGDGVEEAFFTTDRVMTVSFHRFGDNFFPGTGGLNDVGAGRGSFYALNVPLKAGMDDASYESIFVPIMSKVMETYQPAVIVLQCGADSLAGDRLGTFNLTLKGHGKCVEFMRSFNIPLMLLGGGGYTVKNVARCWAYETSIALNIEIPSDMPNCDYYNYFQPNLKLHFEPDMSMENKNTEKSLRGIITSTMEKLRNLQPVPSVQFKSLPVKTGDISGILEEIINPEESMTRFERDRLITPDNELYDEYF